MAQWRRRPRLLTSYGYRPPPEATIRGRRCASRDCGAPVGRLRRRCGRCGGPADPEFDEPWAHEALGAELSWLARTGPAREAGAARDRLVAWRVKDAVVRRDDLAAAQARQVMHDYADRRRTEDSRWSPGPMLGLAVFGALGLRDLDGAAGDLCLWLELSGGEETAGGPCAFGNATSVMQAVVSFLAAPGGAAHPMAEEIRRGCLRVAGGCLRAGR
jgi:hypothetical protein